MTHIIRSNPGPGAFILLPAYRSSAQLTPQQHIRQALYQFQQQQPSRKDSQCSFYPVNATKK